MTIVAVLICGPGHAVIRASRNIERGCEIGAGNFAGEDGEIPGQDTGFEAGIRSRAAEGCA